MKKTYILTIVYYTDYTQVMIRTLSLIGDWHVHLESWERLR